MDYNYHRTTALLNILVKKGVLTKEEFEEEVKRVRKHEKEVMFGKIKDYE